MSIENTQALDIIGVKKRRLHQLKLQAARTGTTTDPKVTMEIEDLEQEIPILKARAGQAVSAVGIPSALMSGTANIPADRYSALPQPVDKQMSLLAHALIGLVPAARSSPSRLPGAGPPRRSAPD